jgi:hypothetical protein
MEQLKRNTNIDDEQELTDEEKPNGKGSKSDNFTLVPFTSANGTLWLR